jgi:hypothetical protein
LERSEDGWTAKPIAPPLDGSAWQPTAGDTAAAEDALKSCRITWIRDAQGVKEGAVLDGEDAFTCAALFAPSLLDKFTDIFGPEIFVAVPSRFRLYVFPKLAANPALMAPLVLSDYRAAVYPVSPELFQVDAAGVRAVGLLDDR